jgi:hypothetical protein
LYNVVFAIVESALDILSFLIDILNSDSNFGHISHELISKVLVLNKLFFVIHNSEFCSIIHRIGVEQSCSSKSCKVLTIGVTSKHETLRF